MNGRTSIGSLTLVLVARCSRRRCGNERSRTQRVVAMGASNLMAAVACCLVAGCGAVVQPGLANAPGLGGASPETRVHDAIANGRDACERSWFPQGGVLRGQIPPCGKESYQRPDPRLSTPPGPAPSNQLSYPFVFCRTRPMPHRLGVERGLTASSSSPAQLSLACDSSENTSPAGEGGLHLEWTSPTGHGPSWAR